MENLHKYIKFFYVKIKMVWYNITIRRRFMDNFFTNAFNGLTAEEKKVLLKPLLC